MATRLVLSVLLLCQAVACSTTPGPGAGLFNQPISQTIVRDMHIKEASGLAASRVHPGILYTINDRSHSTEENKIYAFDSKTGLVTATITVGGAQNGDWEALAVGPCGGSSCIFVGDVGDDSDLDEPRNVIYRIREPNQLQTETIHYMDELEFTWHEPQSGCLMVDPNGRAFIISSVRGGHGLMAELPASGWGGPVVKLDHFTRLDLNTEHHDPVACDISPDGKEMLIKAHHELYYWKVSNGDYQHAIETLGTPVPYHDERLGEAVAWSVLGDGYYTLGEGYRQHLYYISKKKSITVIG